MPHRQVAIYTSERMANLNGIIEQLTAERDRITRAIEVLEGVATSGRGRRGFGGGRKRRRMSAAARARIAAAQRARWAKQKAAAKKSEK